MCPVLFGRCCSGSDEAGLDQSILRVVDPVARTFSRTLATGDLDDLLTFAVPWPPIALPSPSFALPVSLPLAATANVTVTVAVSALTPLLALRSFPILL